MAALVGEFIEILAQEDRLSALGRPRHKHQIAHVYVLRVDVLEREHKSLEEPAVCLIS